MRASGSRAILKRATFWLDRNAPTRVSMTRGSTRIGGGMWRVKSLDAILATAQKRTLHRSLGPVQLTLLGIGGVIGRGLPALTMLPMAA